MNSNVLKISLVMINVHLSKKSKIHKIENIAFASVRYALR